MSKIKAFFLSLAGFLRADSPVSMSRLIAFILAVDGCLTVHIMIGQGRGGLEIAAVATAYFTAAAGIKTFSKKFEGPGPGEPEQ
jgi:hypothetical protein